MAVSARPAHLLAIASCSVAAFVLASCGGSKATPVARVSVSPWPGGRVGPVAAPSPVPGIYAPLSRIADAVPPGLPRNPKQRCGAGATVRITLEGGTTRTYGPCNRPASIERLRVALVLAAAKTHPFPPSRPVTGREWKSLINDWYDGRIDGWYRCAVVREAIGHLPMDDAFGTVVTDLRSYAHAVCPPVP